MSATRLTRLILLFAGGAVAPAGGAVAPALALLAGGPVAPALALLAGGPAGTAPAIAPPRQEVRAVIEEVRATGGLELFGTRIAVPAPVTRIYERAGYALLWSSAEDVSDLAVFVHGLERDGLDPADYHRAWIRNEPATADQRARLDVVRTTALLRAAYHLRFGRVDAETLQPNESLARAVHGDDVGDALESLLPPRGGRAEWNALRPDNFVYAGLAEALTRLRAVAAQGGWPMITAGESLRPGMNDGRVPALRRRLEIAGDLAAGLGYTTAFDAVLDSAVRRFQHRHGLNTDGIVGPATRAELNVPVERRIDQVRLNLERARWISPTLTDEFVAVNAAGALVYLVHSGHIVFEARAIVGALYTRTPVFTAQMRSIELNPSWTVPPGIVGEILGAVRRDAGYLEANGIRVIDSRGRTIDAAGITFSHYTERTFPWVFRQDPGPANPLGRIKFSFPNRYNVYLHDTPARYLFEREQRTFSHGCIRVQDPLLLAELALKDARWSTASLRAAIETGATRTIPLNEPLQVLVLYWTASADRHGELHFYRDVYGRDAALLAALDAS
ncbi:MAG TPA: L,D-transpeptidase family protein [Longimicrobiales bacterium]